MLKPQFKNTQKYLLFLIGLQPLNVSVNNSFKDKLRLKWEQ